MLLSVLIDTIEPDDNENNDTLLCNHVLCNIFRSIMYYLLNYTMHT